MSESVTESVSESVSESPVYPAAILGLRQWALAERGGELKLRSIGLGETDWEPGVSRAVCRRSLRWPVGHAADPAPHPAPSAECECGLYAHYLTLSHAQRAWIDRESQITMNRIWGVVRARGRAELHEHGFRAEEMEIVCLIEPVDIELEDELDAHSLRDLQEMASRYGVPLLRNSRELRGLLAERGGPAYGIQGAHPERPLSPRKLRALSWLASLIDHSFIAANIIFPLLTAAALAAAALLIPVLISVAVPSSAGELLSLPDLVGSYLVTVALMFAVMVASGLFYSMGEIKRGVKARALYRRRGRSG